MRYKDDLCGLDLNIDHRLRKTEIQYSSSTVFLGEITQEECHHQYLEWYGLAVSSEEGGTSFCSLVRILPAIGPVRIGVRGESYCFSIKVLVVYSFAKTLNYC